MAMPGNDPIIIIIIIIIIIVIKNYLVQKIKAQKLKNIHIV